MVYSGGVPSASVTQARHERRTTQVYLHALERPAVPGIHLKTRDRTDRDRSVQIDVEHAFADGEASVVYVSLI